MSRTIALDADGVLLDYNAAYANAWEKAFGKLPALRDPDAYWPMDHWAVERLSGESLTRFRSEFNEEFWSTIPAIDGAVEACNQLADEGYRRYIACVNGDYRVRTVSRPYSVSEEESGVIGGAERHDSFVRWVDTDWQYETV